MDQSDPEITRDVGGGEDGDHSRYRPGGFGDDLHHIGAGVIGEAEGSVQHPVDRKVVDIAAVSEGEADPFVLGAFLSDATGEDRIRNRCSRSQQLDRLDDLDVSGATAQVGPETALDGGPIEIAPLLVEERFSADHDPWGAEATLQRSGGSKGAGQPIPLGLFKTLQGRHLPTSHLLHRKLTRDGRLAVEQDRAATALTRRSAAVLGRGDAKFLA